MTKQRGDLNMADFLAERKDAIISLENEGQRKEKDGGAAMNEGLKPCPYCGENEDLYENEFNIGPIVGGDGDYHEEDYHEEHRVECHNCGALGPWADTRTGAMGKWNRRKEKDTANE